MAAADEVDALGDALSAVPIGSVDKALVVVV